ncbi:uncharacterized protein LOC106872966 [Octopus bimaculoides]|uniref:UPAR/Ly6 domain-containing protein n=1 Tax=Octopus bimaculoides TaxID=37653 RepID=A0A0L8H3R2_OCTBM|nr:uncharacterized protein LOC106872966 [Octopus bimaculoides]|eukprot:XP_014775640.1 PREDICTED: uncharacterized protein LOC106872966 [Octopus bimaculoides]
MYIYSIAFFPLLVLYAVTNNIVTAECNGCYYDGQCFCNNQKGIYIGKNECKELECKKNKLSTIETYCKVNSGNCLSAGETWMGAVNNLCVTEYCDIQNNQPILGIRSEQVCNPTIIALKLRRFTRKKLVTC